MRNNQDTQLSKRLICIPLLSLLLLNQAHASESWKRPLAEKAEIIEVGIQKRHNILGLYPSMVEIPFDSDKIDITTRNPMADVQHAVCWTANYLAGLSYRYAYLKKAGAEPSQIEIARKRADEVFEGVYRCQLVTGVKGLQARGYFVGHGESYAERQRSTKLPYWRQGEVDGKPFRWVGDPSHHNYSDVIHGLGQYYTLAAEGRQKGRVIRLVSRTVRSSSTTACSCLITEPNDECEISQVHHALVCGIFLDGRVDNLVDNISKACACAVGHLWL